MNPLALDVLRAGVVLPIQDGTTPTAAPAATQPPHRPGVAVTPSEERAADLRLEYSRGELDCEDES